MGFCGVISPAISGGDFGAQVCLDLIEAFRLWRFCESCEMGTPDDAAPEMPSNKKTCSTSD